MGIIERKKNLRVSSKKRGWSYDSKQTYIFFGPIHFGLLHLFLLALSGQEKNIVVTCVSGSLPKNN